jgi:ABC-2 type transport system permease protein
MGMRNHWIALHTIVVKEVLRFLRIWIQTLLPAAVTTALYFTIFGALIGSRLGGVGGVDYLEYIVPGVILMAVISNSYSNVVSSFFSTKYQRYVEELLVSPLPAWVIVSGYALGGVARGLAVGLVVTGVASLFTELRVHSHLLSLAVVVLTSAVFALSGFINAVFARSFDDISVMPTFVLTPLTYLGGVFYSVDMLPPFWAGVSHLNPILYMVNALRYGMLGVSDVPLGVAFALIGLLLATLAVLGVYLLHGGVGVKS